MRFVAVTILATVTTIMDYRAGKGLLIIMLLPSCMNSNCVYSIKIIRYSDILTTQKMKKGRTYSCHNNE